MSIYLKLYLELILLSAVQQERRKAVLRDDHHSHHHPEHPQVLLGSDRHRHGCDQVQEGRQSDEVGLPAASSVDFTYLIAI